MKLTTILSISRPRFWLYLAGTYLVGFAFATQNPLSFQTPFFILHFLYFLIPANILLYGINDYFDQDTDKFNHKKGDYEHKLLLKEKNSLLGVLLICLALTFFLMAIQSTMESQLLLSLFLFLAYFYSAPPLRFKSKPFIDFVSNILYLIPGLLGFYQITNTLPPFPIIFAIFCWISAMHLFSAIPDISADTKAQIKTTAVLLGKNNSLILCGIFWLMTALIAVIYINSPLASLAAIYPLIPLFLLITKNNNLEKVYHLFPYLNTLNGFLLFLFAIL